MGISFVRKKVWDSAFGLQGGGTFDCTDCDFVVVFGHHGGPNSVTVRTLDGVVGDFVDSAGLSPEDHYCYNYSYSWLTPGSGTKTLVLTWSGNGGNRTLAMGYKGVMQAPIVQAIATTAWAGSISDIMPNTKMGNLVIDDVCCLYGTPWTNRTAGALQTVRSSTAWGADSGKLMESASEEPGNGGNVTMSWTASGTPKMAQISLEIAPAAGGNRMILMMSEIYKGIQENRKKLGIGDLGNFGLKDGLWKPKEGLATI